MYIQGPYWSFQSGLQQLEFWKRVAMLSMLILPSGLAVQNDKKALFHSHVAILIQHRPLELNLKNNELNDKKELEALTDYLKQVYYQNYKSAYNYEGMDEPKYDCII